MGTIAPRTSVDGTEKHEQDPITFYTRMGSGLPRLAMNEAALPRADVRARQVSHDGCVSAAYQSRSGGWHFCLRWVAKRS